MDVCAGFEPLVELTRGGIVESVHLGALAAVDSEGKLLAAYGNPDRVSFPRSSMKPLQALPFVEDGGPEHFGLTEEELAILCASHHGTDEHVRVLRSIHAKVGLQELDLQCGVHWPPDKATVLAMRERGEEPTPYRHNCSGKHSGMLAQALLHAFRSEAEFHGQIIGTADHAISGVAALSGAAVNAAGHQEARIGFHQVA